LNLRPLRPELRAAAIILATEHDKAASNLSGQRIVVEVLRYFVAVQLRTGDRAEHPSRLAAGGATCQGAALVLSGVDDWRGNSRPERRGGGQFDLSGRLGVGFGHRRPRLDHRHVAVHRRQNPLRGHRAARGASRRPVVLPTRPLPHPGVPARPVRRPRRHHQRPRAGRHCGQPGRSCRCWAGPSNGLARG
jgi:hypothetical protein